MATVLGIEVSTYFDEIIGLACVGSVGLTIGFDCTGFGMLLDCYFVWFEVSIFGFVGFTTTASYRADVCLSWGFSYAVIGFVGSVVCGSTGAD